MNRKTKKTLFTGIAFIIVIALVIGTIEICKNIQFPKKEKALSFEQRQVLTENFTPVDLSSKKESKRVIDNKNPLNLLNYYGDEPVLDLWSSIPENQKPYTVLLIIPGHTLLPGSDSSLKMLVDTAQICEDNQIPYAIQNTNGEIAPEERLPVAYLEKEFAQKHEYFYGLNAAELYNSISWRAEADSNNSQYIIDCINLCAKYGGYFFWTDTNMNYDSGMILEWFETNEAFYSAFKENSKYICLMNKESYGKPSTYSCMQGLWLAGLVGNWGVASDWWHWQVDGDKKSLFGEYDNLVDNEWDMIINFPENMYVQSMMLVMSAGGTCFKAEAPNFSTSCDGKRLGGFEYGISPLLDRVISGKISIPSKEEVLAETPIAVLGYENYPNFNYDEKVSNLYPSTGKYGIIPLLPSNLRNDEIEIFNENRITLVDTDKPQSFYDEYYSDVDSDTYLRRISNQWYFIHSVENERCVKKGTFESVISSAQQVSIKTDEHTSAIITENKDSLDFYVSNYRTDKKQMVKEIDDEYMKNNRWYNFSKEYLVLDSNGNPVGIDDTKQRTTVITVKGSYNSGKPELVLNNSTDGKGYQNRPYSYTEEWDGNTNTLTLTFKHNGILDFSVLLDKSDKAFAPSEQGEFTPYIKEKTDSFYDELENLIITLKTEKNHIYNEYSYMQFNDALEKAKVIISEKTYTQTQVDDAVKELQSAYDNLLDLTEYGALLKSSLRNTLSEEQGAAYDALLREALSNRVYIDGRSQSLNYKYYYQIKNYNKADKQKKLDKKSDALSQIIQSD